MRFEWTPKEMNLFNDLKSIWSQELMLRIANTEKPFELETDALNIPIGAVLRQDKIPVTFILKVLNTAEQNYGITEKEALAIVWATEKIKYHLLGNKFKIITDHKAL